MRDYIHKCFIKFYYNGIFLKMTGKLKHLENNKNINKEESESHLLSIINEKSSENINNKDGENNNINSNTNKNEKKEIDAKEKEKNDLKERMKKSRGLRRIMAKKANERIEKLRINFYKFYRAGIISTFRKVSKRNSCQLDGNIAMELRKKLLNEDISDQKTLKNKNTKILTQKEREEKEELKEKVISALKKIIFKVDRRNMIVLKKAFNKYYLRAKLESVVNIIDNDKAKKKKKKKGKKKKKSLEKQTDKEEKQKNEINSCEDDKENDNENS